MRALIIGLVAAIVLLLGGLTWFAVTSLSESGDVDPFETRFDENAQAGSSVDSAARIEIEVLRGQMQKMQEAITALQRRIDTLEQRPLSGLGDSSYGGNAPPLNQGPNDIIDAYAQVVLIANRRQVNRGLKVANPRFLEEFLGRPRETLSDDCEEMTNPDLKAMLKVEQVGPIRVAMLQPALDSLRRVFANVQSADPDLYARIQTAGALCVRQIRGTTGRTSTHSFGLAVDLNIDGQLDTLGDGKTQLGLTILADFFRDEGWVWGAGFGREDSMHFEVSRQKLEEWRSDGRI
ncbi:MAG: M15 family metallopeptidase [Marinibacterium sp.]